MHEYNEKNNVIIFEIEKLYFDKNTCSTVIFK